MPSDLCGEELDYALAHEEAHLRRYDHWWKPLGFLILSVYWFNPLCWAAYILLCRDIEFACDEKVVKEMGGHHVKEYSRALLDLSLMRRRITACPLAFGELSVKQRVKRILNYKEPAFWVIAVSLIACAVLAVCFLTDPKGKAQGATDGSEPAGMETNAQTDPEDSPSESLAPTAVSTEAPTEAAAEAPTETPKESLYGRLSPEEEAAVCQVVMEHIYEVFDEVFPKEGRAFEKEDLIAVLEPAVHWGEYFRHGGFEWMEYTKKYGVEGHPDRIAYVGINIRPGAEGSTQGYSVFLVKPLDTDTWIIVNYGF